MSIDSRLVREFTSILIVERLVDGKRIYALRDILKRDGVTINGTARKYGVPQQSLRTLLTEARYVPRQLAIEIIEHVITTIQPQTTDTTCPICGKQLPGKRYLYNHLKIVHKQTIQTLTTNILQKITH